MIISTHKGKHKIEYSVVSVSELEGAIRIDAEYYDPSYLRNERKIRKKEWDFLGNNLSICEYGISIAMNEEGIGYKILRMDEIIGILADDSNAKYAPISRELFERYKLNKKDVLFNRVNSEEFVGRTGIYLLDGEHTFASYLIRIRAQKDHTNAYIAIFLSTKYGKACLRQVSRRAVNQANINAEELKQLKIPFPFVDFQKEIESLVLKAQREKEKSEKLYKQAEEILLNELGLEEWKPKAKKIKIDGKDFEEEENISIKNLSDILKADRLDAEYWEPRYDEIENLIKNYNGTCDYLPKLVDISREKIMPAEDKTYNYIELADINPLIGSVNQTQRISGANLPSRARMKIKKGDILMSSVEGSIDKIALVDFEKENLVASTGFFVLREKKLNGETILVMLKLLSKIYLQREAQGTILTAIPYNSLNRLILLKIDRPLQSRISRLIQQSFQAKRNNKKLLKIAKRAVEIYIEKDEQQGLNYIKERL